MSISVLAVLAGIVMTGCESAKKEPTAQRPPDQPREIWEFASVTAAVEAVDVEARALTLRGPRGNVFTVTADERVRRFDEVHVGDRIVVDYYMSFATELREPTAEERESPLTVLEGAGRTSTDAPPGVGGLREIKAVVTVEGIDRLAETVTVKGPLGRYATVRVVDPARLEGLSIGDTVVVTYTEALAISLEKTG